MSVWCRSSTHTDPTPHCTLRLTDPDWPLPPLPTEDCVWMWLIKLCLYSLLPPPLSPPHPPECCVCLLMLFSVDLRRTPRTWARMDRRNAPRGNHTCVSCLSTCLCVQSLIRVIHMYQHRVTYWLELKESGEYSGPMWSPILPVPLCATESQWGEGSDCCLC